MARILVVEDEAPMRVALKDCLERHGYRVLVAANGEQGLDTALKEKPDLLVLDIMMPKLDGFALCAAVRGAAQRMPILMLTAKGQVEDRVRGLDLGADDFLAKPFSRDELLARVRALLRRAEQQRRLCEEVTLGRITVSFAKNRAWKEGEDLHLTAKEFATLRLLVEADGAVVTRERFLDVVWGYTAFPTTRTVDRHVAGLRAKLESDPEQPEWIHTVHGVGYRLEKTSATRRQGKSGAESRG